jgi:hypothetical protein
MIRLIRIRCGVWIFCPCTMPSSFSAKVFLASSTTRNYTKIPKRSQMKNHELEFCESISHSSPLALTTSGKTNEIEQDTRTHIGVNDCEFDAESHCERRLGVPCRLF